jgi:hypothetical protein
LAAGRAEIVMALVKAKTVVVGKRMPDELEGHRSTLGHRPILVVKEL